ncbi:MAG: hypothetical protein ABGW87_06270 [Sphingomonadaceae bacterium]
MRILLASVAALALAASGAHAQGHGNGHGNSHGSNGGGGGKPAAAQKHQGNGGGGNGSHGAQKHANSGGGNAKHVAQAKPQANHGNDNRGGGHSNAARSQAKPQQHSSAMKHANQGQSAHNQSTARAPIRQSADNGARDGRVSYAQRDTRQRDYEWLRRDRSRQPNTGCPPGLAKKHNGCNPPGQVRDREVYRRSVYGSYYRPRLFGYTGYNSGDYYYRDGYLLRYNDNSIASWLPLLGGALGIGNVWPSSYQSYDVPQYYQDYYDLGEPGQYRYADGVMYRVNPGDGAITSIAGLITGDTFQVGQPMPPGYDVYNVPYGYRDRYYDTPDEMYRYSDGYIYQMDPTTRLIQAVISLLT